MVLHPRSRRLEIDSAPASCLETPSYVVLGSFDALDVGAATPADPSVGRALEEPATRDLARGVDDVKQPELACTLDPVWLPASTDRVRTRRDDVSATARRLFGSRERC